MMRLQKERIATRISIALGTVMFVAIVTISAILSLDGFSRDVSQRVELIEGSAKIFASNIAEPMASRDERNVQQVLTAIGKFEQFRYTSVDLPDGSIFAEMGGRHFLTDQDSRSGELTIFNLLKSDKLWVRVPVIYAGETIGFLRLLSDIDDMRIGLMKNLGFDLLMAVIVSLLAIFIGRRLVKAMTKPLYLLTKEMDRLGSEGSFDLRLPDERHGEIGTLTAAFERMMKEIRQRDEQLRDHKNSLEQRVEERTLALKHAKDKADQANNAKSEFLATMSHEIRTPMNGMLVMAELLTTAQLRPKHQRYAEIVLKTGKGLLTILNDILDYSKIQSGKLELESIEVDLGTLVDDVLNLFSQQAAEKKVDLGAFVTHGVPRRIWGDQTRLNQILSNLINNALKFTEEGSVSVYIDFEPDTETSGKLLLKVRDTGIGIPKEKLDHIFDVFAQADQTTTRKYGGTGLGLAICRNLAEAMGGSILISSTEGEGSEFAVEIRASLVETRNESSNVPVYGENRYALVSTGSVCADTIIGDLLTAWGFQFDRMPTTASIAPEAIEKFDLIVAACSFFKSHYFTNSDQIRIAASTLGETDIDGLLSSQAVHDLIQLPASTFATGDELRAILEASGDRDKRVGNFSDRQDDRPAFPDTCVLVADDSAVNREVIHQALLQFGIEPKFAVDGMEALTQFARLKPDIVFMDCSMPRMDGYSATSRIRDHERECGFDRSAIVALSAHVGEQFRERATAAGMDDFLAKPFTINALEKALTKWLQPGIERERHPLSSKQTYATPLDEEIFDRKAIENLREIAGDGFEAMQSQLHALFLSNATVTFEKLTEAANAGDHDTVANYAHALKSMAMNIAATRLGSLLAELEAAAPSGKYAEQMKRTTAAYKKLIDCLESTVGAPSEDLEHHQKLA